MTFQNKTNESNCWFYFENDIYYNMQAEGEAKEALLNVLSVV